jgi:methylenetetrahydrofolate dehydrogenase (NADP+) / methenyltetrahydrofolate cyclohydrolase
MLAKDVLGSLDGLEAVVIGRSNIVGKPVAQLLLAENCTVTIAHSKTKDLPAVVRRADLVIAAVGRPEMVKGDWLKPGATVIDVGINRIERDGKGKLVGDCDYASCEKVAGAITPVPGGVGPMTIACLLYNTVKAACAAKGITQPEMCFMVSSRSWTPAFAGVTAPSYFAFFARSIASRIICSASAALPQPTTFTHLPGSRSL